MSDYIYAPFGVSGVRAPIPVPLQPSGSVSYTTGFTVNYTQKLGVVPTAIPVPLDQFNQLMYATQKSIQTLQQQGFPDFITTADNQGSPFPYAKNAYVRYDDGTGAKVYVSLVDDNVALPSDSDFWDIWEDTALDPQVSQGVWAPDIGAVNAYIANPVPSRGALLMGSFAIVFISNTNTGASTLNINGLGNINIILKTGLGLSGGELQAGRPHQFIFDGAYWVLLNPWTSIIEGSNSNGYYCIYPSGRIEQWGTFASPTSSSTSFLPISHTFPMAFPNAVTNLTFGVNGVVSSSSHAATVITDYHNPLLLTGFTGFLDSSEAGANLNQPGLISWSAKGN